MPAGEMFYTDWNRTKEKEHPVYDVNYKEGVFVGYRWYESKKIEPLYPFGYGLSYTAFDYSDLTVSKDTMTETDTLDCKFHCEEFRLNKRNGNCSGLC